MTQLRMRRTEDNTKNEEVFKDDCNNNTNFDLSEHFFKDETCLNFSLISSVSETETDSSDISLGDSDDADDDLTDTSESLDTESDSGSFVEFDSITDIDDIMLKDAIQVHNSPYFQMNSSSSVYSLYTIVEEEESSENVPEVASGSPVTPGVPLMTDLQKYFRLLGEDFV